MKRSCLALSLFLALVGSAFAQSHFIHFADSMDQAFRSSGGTIDHPAWEAPVSGNSPSRERDPAHAPDPYMALGNGTIMARLPYSLTEDFELRLMARHRNWGRIMIVGLGNAERTQGYFFSWDSALEGQLGNQGRVDIRKMDLSEPFSTWQFPSQQLTPYVVSGAEAPIVGGGFTEFVFSWRATDGRLRLYVDGVLRREAFDTQLSAFNRIFIRGNTMTHFDNLEVVSTQPLPPAYTGPRRAFTHLVDRFDLPRLLNERWTPLSGAAEIVQDGNWRRLAFTQNASRLSRPLAQPVASAAAAPRLNIAYEARRSTDSGTMTGVFLVDGSGTGYGFITELGSAAQNFARLRVHETSDWGASSTTLTNAYLDDEGGASARQVTFSWDRQAGEIHAYLDQRKSTLPVGALDPNFNPSHVVVYGFSANARLDALSISGVPAGAIDLASLGAVGDGVANDTEAILTALARALKSGAPVYVPPGIYRYDRVLNLQNTTWIGAGPASELAAMDDLRSVIKLSGDGGQVAHLKVTSPTFENGNSRSADARAHNLAATGASNFNFTNVSFEGGRTTGLFVRWSRDGEIFGNAGRNIRADGMHFTGGSSNVVVRENSIFNSGDDMFACVAYIGRGGPLPEGLDFYGGEELYPNARGFSKPVSGIQIIDNFGYDQPWGRGITAIGGRDILIEGNTVFFSEGAGILITSEATWFSHATRDIVIRNNILRNGRGNYGQSAIFVEGRSGFSGSNILIENNDIAGHNGGGIRTSRYNNNVVIRNNTLTNIPGFGIAAQVRSTADTFSVNDLIVEGNSLSNIGQQGILVDGRARGNLSIIGNSLNQINLSGSGNQSVIHVQSGNRLSQVQISGNDWTQPGRREVEHFIENRTPAPLVINDVLNENTYDIPSSDTFWRRGVWIFVTWRVPIVPHTPINEANFPLHQWRQTHFGSDFQNNPDAALDADPNNNGITNLESFALNLNPWDASADGTFVRPRFHREVSGEDQFVGIDFRVNSAATDLRFEVEYSWDLSPGSWSLLDTTEAMTQIGTEAETGTPIFRLRMNLNPITETGRDANANPIFGRLLENEIPPERIFLRLRVSRQF